LSIVFLEIAAKRPKTKTWLMCLSDKMNVVYFSMFFSENPPVFQHLKNEKGGHCPPFPLKRLRIL